MADPTFEQNMMRHKADLKHQIELFKISILGLKTELTKSINTPTQKEKFEILIKIKELEIRLKELELADIDSSIKQNITVNLQQKIKQERKTTLDKIRKTIENRIKELELE